MATLSIDKSNWQLVKLGDVAHEVRESLTKSNVQVDRSVGLENIEPGDLHIRSWDEFDESSSFTKVFREGHVLFGRRRAYLKKAALADFNGVCSGDITVISASEDLLPSLLPFVVSSDRFFAFAVEHSAGGLSPRVKWKDLANYEFLLPPKYLQVEIAELLWQGQRLIENSLRLENTLKVQRSSTFESLLNADGSVERDLKKMPLLSSFFWFQEGPGVRKVQFRDSGVKLLNGTNIQSNSLDLKLTNRFISGQEAKGKYAHFLCDSGDLLIACSGITVESFDEKVAFVSDKHLPLCMNTSTMRFKAKSPKLNLLFLNYFLRSSFFKNQIQRLVTGSAQLNFGPSHMQKIRLIVPSPDVLARFFEDLAVIEDAIEQTGKQLNALKGLMVSLKRDVL